MRIAKSKVNEYKYRLKSDMEPMQISTDEKDLGVVIDNKLNFEKPIVEKVNKAYSIMRVIRRTFVYMDDKIFLILYLTSETTC